MDLHLVTGRGGKEHVTAADHGAFHVATLIDGNIVLNRGNTFTANIVSNNLIKILDGELLMQGRYVRLESGSYIEVPIENGSQDYKRNDLIVVKYTKDATTGVEGVCLEVIKGTATTGTATDPAYNPGSILNGDLEVIFPLYRIPIVGLSVQEPEAMFEITDNFDERLKALASGKVDKVAGKGLSTNDYSDAEKKKVAEHIADTASHVTTTEKETWNGKANGTHTHNKSQITDFPTSMPASDVYSWAKASSKPSYTKSEVGLGNVDNTADADKSVKYATSAGSANAVAWGNVSGKPSSFTPASHNQAASTVTAGTLAGQVKANASAAATLGNSQIRNIYAGTTDMTAGVSDLPAGDIYFFFEQT